MRARCDVSPFPETRFDAGQTLRLSMAAGTVLVARAGRLRVRESPRWLGERMVVVGQDLADGQAHVVGDAGWVEVSALDETGGWLHRIDAEPASASVRTWLRFLVRAWSGRSAPVR